MPSSVLWMYCLMQSSNKFTNQIKKKQILLKACPDSVLCVNSVLEAVEAPFCVCTCCSTAAFVSSVFKMSWLTTNKEQWRIQEKQWSDTSVTWLPRWSLSMEISHWPSSNLGFVPTHSPESETLIFQMECKMYFYLTGLWTTGLKPLFRPSMYYIQYMPIAIRYRNSVK